MKWIFRLLVLCLLAGAFLVRRFAPSKALLEDERSISVLLVYGGPVSCVLSATTGIVVLYAGGLLDQSSALFNWSTWWVGDTIGVLIFAPLVLIWTAYRKDLPLRRQLLVSLPSVATFALVLCLFMYASERTSSTLAAFTVDPATGKLTYVSSTPTEKQPRGFAIDPSGRFLVATGEKSENVAVYAIDGATGALKPVGKAPVGKGANWVEIVRFD